MGAQEELEDGIVWFRGWNLRSHEDMLPDRRLFPRRYPLKVINVPLETGDVVDSIAGFYLMDKRSQFEMVRCRMNDLSPLCEGDSGEN